MATLGVEILKDKKDTLPLIIQPRNIESSSVEYLKEWIAENQEAINKYLLTYGKLFSLLHLYKVALAMSRAML